MFTPYLRLKVANKISSIIVLYLNEIKKRDELVDNKIQWSSLAAHQKHNNVWCLCICMWIDKYTPRVFEELPLVLDYCFVARVGAESTCVCSCVSEQVCTTDTCLGGETDAKNKRTQRRPPSRRQHLLFSKTPLSVPSLFSSRNYSVSS